MDYSLTNYAEAIERGEHRHGAAFVPPSANTRQKMYFSGCRVEITTTYPSGNTWVRRGRIGITTGWKPALLLVSRRGVMGSSDVLNENDIVTAWIDDKGKRHPLD